MTPEIEQPTHIVINSFEASSIVFYQLLDAMTDYWGIETDIVYHTIKNVIIDQNRDKTLEFCVTNITDPATMSISHRFIDHVAIQIPASLRGLLSTGPSIDNQLQLARVSFRTDIEASVEAIVKRTSVIPKVFFRLPARRFADNPHWGRYISVARDANDQLMLVIFPYDSITGFGLPGVDPNVRPFGSDPLVHYGMTPSCGVKIPGGGS